MYAKDVMSKFDYIVLWLVNGFGKALTWTYNKFVDPVESMYAKKYNVGLFYDTEDGIKIIE